MSDYYFMTARDYMQALNRFNYEENYCFPTVVLYDSESESSPPTLFVDLRRKSYGSQ